LFNHLRHRCPEEQVHEIVTEAVVIEKEFLSDALPVGLIGINANVRPAMTLSALPPCYKNDRS
jgi:ribonucleoside-diphosphate reductase subunit M2